MRDDTDYDTEDDMPAYWVDETRVVIQYDEVLPLRCIRTNVRVEPADLVTSTLYYVPVLAYFILPFALLPVAIVILCIRKPVKVTYGLSRQVRQQALLGKVAGGFIAIAGIAVVIAAVVNESGGFVLAGFLIIVGGLVGLVLNNTEPTVTRYEKSPGRHSIEEFWLRGFHRDYLTQLEQDAEELDRQAALR